MSAVALPPASAVSTRETFQNRLALLAALASPGTVLPPRIEQIDIQTQDAPDSIPVVRVDFPGQVFFDFDRDALWPNAQPVIAAIAERIRRDVPGVQVTIVGHTDAIGTDAYNLDLSRRRALSVMQALVADGVDPGALSTAAVGKRQPAAPDDTPAGRAENRRVEFLVSFSLQANLMAVAGRSVQAADLPADVPPGGAVPVLRPQRTADPRGPLTLAAIGSVALAAPVQPQAPAPEAVPEQPAPLPVAHPAAPVSRVAPLTATPPAVPRPLAPQYTPRLPGPALTY